MVTVNLLGNNQGKYIGFVAQGHAGYAENGYDIVCAAVSTLTQATVVGIVEVLKVQAKTHSAFGYLDCIVEERIDEIQTLMQVLHLSLLKTEELYGNYLKVLCTKV